MAGMSRSARAARVDEVLALVGLAELSARRVSQLSGGEQQRVALARTLAPRPRVLMLDEPLGSLDRLLHDRLVDDLRAVLRAADVPALVVTHDHDEAMALADRIVLLRDGRVVQSDTPADLWRAPRDEWVARFLVSGPCSTRRSRTKRSHAVGSLSIAAGAVLGAARRSCGPDAVARGGWEFRRAPSPMSASGARGSGRA